MINLKPIEGHRDKVILLDQTLLPIEEKRITLTTLEQMSDAIKRLVVRGAPAIGIAAAYGICLHIEKARNHEEIKNLFLEAYETLKKTRPTAVNLFWALERMKKTFEQNQNKALEEIKEILFQEACQIEKEDYEMCRKIGEYGYSLIKDKENIRAMTICNAGGLATAGYGTALAVFYMAKEKGKNIEVFALETRPLLQGSRLTVYELLKAGIKTTLLTDNMAGSLMQNKSIDFIIAGADRIAANGDTANKIGTYQLAVLAHHHRIPFYIAAPLSTFDPSLSSGKEIPIEMRGKEEIIRFGNIPTAPIETEVYSPAFDVTPNQYISAIITNQGVFYPPFDFK